MLKNNFWKKDLKNFSKEEWEALCDRCGKCCLIKLEDEDTLYFTNVSCKLLCTKTAKCSDYKNRKKKVKECIVLTYQNLEALNWMPNVTLPSLATDELMALTLSLLGLGGMRSYEKSKGVARENMKK